MGLVALLVACTGTREAPTPVFLVVTEGQRIGLVASPLPAGSAPETDVLVWLDEFEHELDGDVLDVAVARDLPTRVLALYRDDAEDSDQVQPFLASAVQPGVPETFEPDGAPLDIGEVVRASGVLTTADLCAREIGASDDGRWLAVLHEPSQCGLESAGAAVVLLDLTVEPTAAMVAYPDVASTPDAATPPTFLRSPGGTAPGSLLYLEADGALVRVSLPDDGDVAREDTYPLGPIDPVGLGTGGLGLVIAESDVLHSIGATTAGDPVSLPSDLELTGVVDAGSLPNAPAVLLGDDRLIVRRELDAADPVDAGQLAVPGLADATVGPYGYGYLLAADRIVVVDLLTYVGTGEGRPVSEFVAGVGGTDLPIEEAVAIEWIFGAVPTAQP